MTQRRETAGVTTRLIVEYVRSNYGDFAVERMVALAGETRPLSVLEDESVWSTYDQKIALFEAAAEVTGRDDVAYVIGTTVLASSVGTSLKVALGMLSSPSSLLRMVARACAKFSTAGDMRALDVTATSGVVHYRVKDGYSLSHFDCDYSAGLLTQVPALFGLPPAVIEHDQCQVRGAEECVYRLRWHRRARLPWRRGRQQVAADALLARLHQLHETLGDLVATRNVDDVLNAVAARAGSAVSAERFVLAAQLDPAEPVRVRYDGFDRDAAHEVADALINGRPLRSSDHTLVVEVRGAVCSYGHLVAFARYPFLEHERDLLEAYGRLAATALDAVSALAAAEDRRRTAEALLGLAGRLHQAGDRAEISTVVSQAAQKVVDADVASILLFDEDDDTLRVSGHAGWPDDLVALLPHVQVRREDTPELDDLLRHPEQPRLYDDACSDPYLRAMLQEFRTRLIAVVPIRGPHRLYGALIAGWAAASPVPVVGATLFAKLAGLADQATNAFEKAALVDQVHLQATTDALTGVANRRLLADRLREAVETADADAPPALLFIDLDRFKLVNDTLGHAAGDELLKAFAARLQHCVRTDDLVARLGGDEFTVLLPSVTDEEAAVELGAKICATLAEPVIVEGRTLHVRCSIGVVVVAPGSATAGDVLRDADAAMYVAKKSGGNRCVVYDPSRLMADRDALDIESDLYAAVTEKTLHVAYQPQIDLTTGSIVGVEALVRWTDAKRGSVAPDRFLPVAERTGLIVPLDLWVLETACAQGVRWLKQGLQLRVAINISARTLTDPQFGPAVLETLRSTGFPAESLELELTEATAVADIDAVCAVLDMLRDHGVSVAIDDLGTGYSSLSWVSNFPVDRIKVDRSFVADLDCGGRGAPLVEAIIGIAARLGHGVLAEGVETQAQADRLLELGCVEAQGYLFAAPTTPDDITVRALGISKQPTRIG